MEATRHAFFLGTAAISFAKPAREFLKIAMGRGLGKRQRQFLSALDSLDARRRKSWESWRRQSCPWAAPFDTLELSWFNVWQVVNEVYERFYKPEWLRQTRVQLATPGLTAQDRDLLKFEQFCLINDEQEADNAKRLEPVEVLERALNPSQILDSLEHRGLIERRKRRGPASKVRLSRKGGA